MPAASTRPPAALPAANPMLRTTWLKLIAEDVSPAGVAARITPGIAAEKPPTPKPRIAIAASTSNRFARASATLVSLITSSSASRDSASSTAPATSSRADRPPGAAGIVITAAASATAVTNSPSPYAARTPPAMVSSPASG